MHNKQSINCHCGIEYQVMKKGEWTGILHPEISERNEGGLNVRWNEQFGKTY